MQPERLDNWELIDERGSRRPAHVPGTVADALRASREAIPDDLDAGSWTFRTEFAGRNGEPVTLRFDGIATHADIELNGDRILSTDSMFRRYDVAAELRDRNVLEIRCRPLKSGPRTPRARWRTKVADNALRFERTSILGRAPGFAPGPAPVGPWGPVTIIRRPEPALTFRARVDGELGIVTARVETHAGAERVELELGDTRANLDGAGSAFTGELRIEAPKRWWPHTHGEPALHPLRLVVDGEVVAEKRLGFRALGDALPVHVNGVRVFARGAVWIPGTGDLRDQLEQVVDCGMNILRVCGLGAYEQDEFHDLCDELGILVWQDFMFANFDYPIADDAFRANVEAELREQIDAIGWRPSLTVLCGGSEIEQQAAMLGLDPALGRNALFYELIPSLLAETDVHAVYVPSSPTGGDLPFSPRSGVANYFGVGAYRRPLEDARRADVRFAGECLAFANMPGDETVERLGSPTGDAWKRTVPRDVGADWDFEDVRDHYLELLFGVEPTELRRREPDRYLELSRATTGEVMAEVFGEWRRGESSCDGGLVLWLRDLIAGAGWGIVEADGSPKTCWHHLRRVLAPIAVWTTDEGLNGIDIHVANDRPAPLSADLRVSLHASSGHTIAEASETVSLLPHTTIARNAEGMLGRFVDAARAYRFGPPAHEAVIAALSVDGSTVSRAFRFPAGRPQPVSVSELGLTASTVRNDSGIAVRVATDRLAYGVRIRVRGWLPEDDGFTIEPGGERLVRLRPREELHPPFQGVVTALNLVDPVPIEAGNR